jgi:hypothetical protein
MSRFLAALLLLICWLPQAHARVSAGAPPVQSFCPLGNLVADGCWNSAIVQHGLPGYFQVGVSGPFASLPSCWVANGGINQISGSTTSYLANSPAVLNPYNDPGCAYAIGPYTPLAQTIEPVSGPFPGTASTIPGCTYNPTGGTNGPLLTCQGASVPHVNLGYNFGPDSNHPCIPVQFNASGLTGDYTFGDSYWQNDGNCAGGPNNPYFFGAANNQNVTIHLLDDVFDGQGTTFSDFFGPQCEPTSTSVGKSCNATEAMDIGNSGAGGGSLDIERSVFLNFVLRGIIPNMTPGGNLTFTANWVQGNNFRFGGDHGEFFQPGFNIGAGGQFLTFNNFIMPTATANTSEAPWPYNFGAPGTVTVTQSDHNIQIGASPGGTVVGTNTPIATIAAGTSTLTFSQAAGGPTTWKLGSGIGFSTCVATTSGAATGTIVGNTWTPKSNQPSAGPGGGWNGGSTLPQSWGFDLNDSGGTLPFVGFIDDGSGNGIPSGIAGNVLTVTVPALFNLGFGNPFESTITGGATSGTFSVSSVTGGQMTVTSAPTGSLFLNNVVTITGPSGDGIPAGTTITGQISGTPGGEGVYSISSSSLSLGAVTLTGTTPGITSPSGGLLMTAALNGATGGVGQYTVNGNAQDTGGLHSLSANYTGTADGTWSAAVNMTCTGFGTAPSSRMFLDIQFEDSAAGPPPAPFTSPVVLTNNRFDESPWGANAPNSGWNQRGNGTSNGAFTATIASGSMTVSSVPTNNLYLTSGLKLSGSGIPANVTITGQTSGTLGGEGVYPTSDASLNVGSESVTATTPGNSFNPLTAVAVNNQVTFPVTAFIDDGLGGGTFDGNPGTTMTVTSTANALGWSVFANPAHGASVNGSGVVSSLAVVNGSGSGGTGSYILGPLTGTFNASVSGGSMTVTTFPTNNLILASGVTVSGGSMPAGTTITGQTSIAANADGVPGGEGVYTLSDTTLTAGSASITGTTNPVQAVAPETMNVAISGCAGQPTIFSGNISLTGLYTNAFWNSWASVLPGSHC